ncbi:MAG: CarD family transcriptional regulator [Pyrinomonadaceae bacterium]
MELTIGQKVAYPNQGVCLVEEFSEHAFGSLTLNGYTLRVLHDNSTIFVPECNADNVGLRPLISTSQCRSLMKMLAADFEPFAGDWKTRSREFTEKLRTGDIFQTAEVLKMLTFLSHMKKLSFREQTLLEKSKFLIVSEISNADAAGKVPAESEIVGLVELACSKLQNSNAMAAVH